MKKIIDSCRIIDWAKSGTLKANFQDMFKNKITIYIPDVVLKETKNKLDEESRITFETVYGEGVTKKCIVYAPKKYRLEKRFKKLKQRLDSTKEFHLSRTDTLLIALSAQLGVPIDTSDSGIRSALAKLKISKNPWKQDFLNSDLSLLQNNDLTEFDFDDGE